MGAVGSSDAAGGGVALPALAGPGPAGALKAAERGVFAFGLGGEAVGDPGLRREPLAEGDGIEPVHAHDGLVGGVELLVVPEAGRLVACREEGRELCIRDGRDGDAEGRDLDAMDGLLVRAAAVIAHQQHAAVEADHLGRVKGVHGGDLTADPGQRRSARPVP